MNYSIKSKNRIICNLCKHHCKLKNNQVGICFVNKNIDGELKNLVYNHPSTIAVDPIEKKPLYHFLPNTQTLSIGTIGCNFKCPFCQNHEISQESILNRDITATKEQVIALALKYKCKSISYTYNEPTIFYPYAKDIALFAKEYNLKNIFVTNGYQSNGMIDDMEGVIDAVNIDLKSFNPEYYKKNLKGNLDEIKSNLIKFSKKNIHIEITTLLIEDINTDLNELKEMAKFIVNEIGENTPWHISSFTPKYKMDKHSPTKLKSIMDCYEIGKEAGLNYVYLGNIPSPNETFCPKCDESIIKRFKSKIEYNYLTDGKCPKCDKKIDGIWS